MITASQLAETRIGRTVPDLPFCQVCFISGINGRPIAHLPSCAVGRVRKAIEDLCAALLANFWKESSIRLREGLAARRKAAEESTATLQQPLSSWDHGDFSSSTSTACEFCGPVCHGGAAHNARVEDNARFDDPKPRCSTFLTFSGTQCRLQEGHAGDHVGKLTDTELEQAR